MIIDCNVMVGKSINGYSLDPHRLLGQMDRLSIDLSVIIPVQPRTYNLQPQNDYIAALSEEYQDRFIGFARIDPRLGEDSERELDRCIKTLGLRGLFLHPWEEGYRVNSSFVVSLVKKAGLMKIPVLIATGFPWVSNALQVGELAGKCRETTIIMTHGGQLNISGLAQNDAFTALKDNPNLMMDTSGVYRQDFIEEVIKDTGMRRVLFGSCSPQFDQEFELERAKSAANGNADVLEKVLGGNLIEVINKN
jgi:predicted TIM-barrel fold metal-dependent hydrolase